MNYSRPSTAMLGVLLTLAMIWFLRISYVVTMPLVFACFIAAALWPVQRFLLRKLGRRFNWLALLASMTLFVLVAAVFVASIATAIGYIAGRAPQYFESTRDLWAKVAHWAQDRGLPVHRLTEGPATDEFFGWIRMYVLYGVASLWSLLGFLALVFFFTAMILVESRRWLDKTQAAFDNERGKKLLDSIRTTAAQVRDYLKTQSAISLTSGIIEGAFLWLLGVELAFVWGLLFFVLNFIPNVGSVVAMVPPTLVALVTLGPWWAAAALGGVILIDTTIGYVVAPLWQGRNLSISPLVVLLSVVFWGWMWGIVGAILAVPLTVAIMVACAHSDATRPVAMLLSSTSDPAKLKRQTHNQGS